MFKEGEESHKKYIDLKDAYSKVKLKLCGSNKLIKTKTKFLTNTEFYNEVEKAVLGISEASDYNKINSLI